MALGRAIAREPQIFLLDEPLSNLDTQLRDDTRAELKQLRQRLGITSIYVTHDQVEAMTLADQIIVLNQGKIQQIAPPQEIYALPVNQMVATFLGSPPMNVLQATFDGSAFQLDRQVIPYPAHLRTLKLLQLVQGQRFNLRIRPEHIQIASSTTHLMVEIILVEPLGREILVRTALLGENRGKAVMLSIQMSPMFRPRVGDRLPLQLDLDHLCIFNPMTGENLSVVDHL